MKPFLPWLCSVLAIVYSMMQEAVIIERRILAWEWLQYLEHFVLADSDLSEVKRRGWKRRGTAKMLGLEYF